MTRFTSVAYTPEGRRYVKQNDVEHFELRVAGKVGIGAACVALSLYLHEIDLPITRIWWVWMVLGMTIIVMTCVSTYLLITRDIDAHVVRTETLPAMPYGVPEESRVIPVNANGVTTPLSLDPKDEELTACILKLLDASIMLSSGDATTFPTYRALNMPYGVYDAALRGLGALVKREKGRPAIVVYPHTLNTIRKMFAEGSLLPFRALAPLSSNRLKQ